MAELGGVEFDVARDGDSRVVITIRGQLDITTTPELEAAAEPVFEDEPPRLILELGELGFADSSALALWVKWAAASEDVETRGASPLLRKVIERMGLARTLGLVR